MQENHIVVERTARYFQYGEVNDKTREIWFVAHGYGYLAKYFLWSFAAIQAPHRVIIAPEALSRYYQQGTSGRIGANWMTREDREHEIRDYVNYLDRLYKQTISELPASQAVRIVLLGFSQGTATFTRWAFLGKVPADNLILWAGGIPPDLDYASRPGFFERCKLDVVYGREDEYISVEDFNEQVKFLQQHNIAFRETTFDGKHVIDRETLVKISQEIGQ